MSTENNPTPEEEIELTEEQQAAARDAEYNKVFFEEEENGEPKSEKKQDEEADQRGEAGQPAEPTVDEAGAEAEAGSEEAGNPDEAAAEGDPDPDADPKPDENTEVKPVTSKLKWKGQEIEVSEEEKTALAQKGFDYTANMQQIAKFRKNIEAAGIDDAMIDLLARANAGDTSAYVELLQGKGLDPTDLIGIEKDENFNHTLQKTENVIVPSEEVAPLIEQIRSNPALDARMEQAEIQLPQSVIKRIATDVNALYMTVGEVESGSFDQVMPRVNARLATMSDFDREAVLNNPDFFVNVYSEEKHRLSNGGEVIEQGDPTPAAETPSAAETKVTTKKKPNMAAVGVKKPTQVDPKAVIKDAFNDDDEFEKTRQRVLANR